jgi:scyllo-inositol 2-dehydrogenase (NADP+)
MIADPGIELVIVATPNTSHFPLAEAALAAGKHVVVDKPFTVTVAEGEALIALAADRGRLLTVFQNRRWDGDFLTIRSLLEERRLGELLLYEAHWDRFRPAIKPGWREVPGVGAGLLWDIGPHMIDQALLLFGLPKALSADIAVQREGAGVDDYFRLTLDYGRMRAVLAASNLVAEPRPGFDLHGTEGSFRKYRLEPQEIALKAGIGPLEPGFGEEPAESYGVLTRGGRSEPVATLPGRYLAFYEAVAASIHGEAPPPVDPADALAGLAILDLAQASARTGRRMPVAQRVQPSS